MAKSQEFEEELSLPRATVVKLAQELLPDGFTISKETQDLILSCCLEFVQMLTFQANQICQEETRNGFLGLAHVIKACKELGFDEYVREIQEVTMAHGRQVKEMQKKKAEKVGWWTKGRDMSEMERMQAQLLEKSKERYEQQCAESREGSTMDVEM